MANQPQNQLLSIQQGVNAQSWSGPAMEEGNTAIGNVNDVVAAGNPNPEDKTPGYLAAGQPQGANVVVIPNTDGNSASGVNLQTVGSPAGTAGGGGYYPGPVNPMLASGWTAQGNAPEDASGSSFAVAVDPEYTGSHTVANASFITPTFSGGTVSSVVATSALPTGLTVTAGTGVVALATSASAGSYVLSFRATATDGAVITYSVLVVLS